MRTNGSAPAGLAVLVAALVVPGCATPGSHPGRNWPDEEILRLIEPAAPCSALGFAMAISGRATPLALEVPGGPALGTSLRELGQDPRFAGFTSTHRIGFADQDTLEIESRVPLLVLEGPGGEPGGEDAVRTLFVDQRDSTLSGVLLRRPLSPADSLLSIVEDLDRVMARIWLSDRGTGGRTRVMIVQRDYESHEQWFLIFDLERLTEYVLLNDPDSCVLNLSG